jgi:hypothetical protein
MLNTAKCEALLADYTWNEYTKERHLLIMAVEVGTAKAINAIGELTICTLQQVRYLREDYFLEEKATVDIVDVLAFTL